MTSTSGKDTIDVAKEIEAEKATEKEKEKEVEKEVENEVELELDVDLGGIDGQDGTGAESHRGTMRGAETPMGAHKK